MFADNKSTPALTFDEACRPFIEAGITARALVPVAPPGARVVENSSLARNRKSLGKVPGRFDARRGEWTGLGGSPPAVSEGLDKCTITEALDWPTGNVGVLGRVLPGIDVDADSEAFFRLAETAFIDTLGSGGGYAERLRGDSLSRTYAFRCDYFRDINQCVEPRRLKIRMSGEDASAPARHGVDIQGYGTQYLISGTHPSGDAYHWSPDRDLAKMHRDGRLHSITNADIDRFLRRLVELVEAAGGEVVHTSGRGWHGVGGGKLHDYNRNEPITSPKKIIDALWKMPNTEENFGSRDVFIGALASIRAALGCNALDQEWEEEVRGWAVGSSGGYCDDDYFDNAWDSLRKGVRLSQEHLPRLLRAFGVRDLDGIDFVDDGCADTSPEIDVHKSVERAAKAKENGQLLSRAAKAYVFQHMGTSTGGASRNIRQPMRLRAHPERVWSATDWWAKLTPDPDPQLLQEMHVAYSEKKIGLPVFLRDLENAYPFAFFTREIRNPRFDYGEVVERYDARDNPDGALNVRQRSQAQNAADKPRRNFAQAKVDTEHFLDFIRRGFGDGPVTEYLLDTFAYMVQTGKRPGHMLVIEGEPGVGKSLFAESLIALFDGTGDHVKSRVDGAKLMNDAALRFIFGKIEGCRICSIKELPEGSGRATTAVLISTVKQMVDAGSGGDYIDIEKKGIDTKSVENHSYIIATTNYENVIPIEERDRRIMPVRFRITQANRPDQEFYVRLGAILKDPERLAAIWNYLAGRAIGQYRADAPPPVTAEKASAQYRSMVPAVRHMAVALDTLAQAGRGIVTLADIVPLANWVAGIEAGESGDWGGGGDLYMLGKPVGPMAGSGAGPMRGKALDYLGEKTRKVEPRKYRGKRTPSVYVLGGRTMPVEDMPWPELSTLLKKDRERHPVRDGVRAKPYDVRIDPIAPVIDRIAGDDEDDTDRAGAVNVVELRNRRRV
ncbi:DUF5906 domain-containing protein [Methylobacterium sp. Leaf99]|uniref:DUF5906 domain-containing protein n=1 Tax=Methylobacterium sp. Leaf99 TaxID=1736251 RepID=UPI000AC064BF|nr:DUF5906 domain-containing protein [Methylobacterium sp. Leaf99]